MTDGMRRFTPQELRHRDPHEVLAPILSDPAVMQRVRDALDYFDQGNPGIPWDQVEARLQQRRAGRTV